MTTNIWQVHCNYLHYINVENEAECWGNCVCWPVTEWESKSSIASTLNVIPSSLWRAPLGADQACSVSGWQREREEGLFFNMYKHAHTHVYVHTCVCVCVCTSVQEHSYMYWRQRVGDVRLICLSFILFFKDIKNVKQLVGAYMCGIGAQVWVCACVCAEATGGFGMPYSFQAGSLSDLELVFLSYNGSQQAQMIIPSLLPQCWGYRCL